MMPEIEKEEENVHDSLSNMTEKSYSSQRVRRARDTTGPNLIKNMIEFANEQPNIVQKQVFCHDNVNRLLDTISKGNHFGVYVYDGYKKKVILNEEDEKYNTEFNSRQLGLAALYIKKGFEIFEEQYKRIYNREFEERLELLKRASKLAEELAFPYRRTFSAPITYNVHDSNWLECKKCRKHEPNCECERCEKYRNQKKE